MGAVLRTGTWWRTPPIATLTPVESVDSGGHTLTTVTGPDGFSAVLTVGSRTVTHTGPTRTFVEQKAPFTDNFERTVTDGWGSSGGGGNYSVTGTASNYSVSGGKGRILQPTTGVSRHATILDTLRDAKVTVKTTVDTTPVGGVATNTIVTGYQDSDNMYRHRISFGVTGQVSINTAKVVANTSTDLVVSSAVVGTGFVAGQYWFLEVDQKGTSIQMRAWLDGSSRPVLPQVSVTDSTYNNGRVGVRAIINTGGVTNTTALFDDFQCEAVWPTPPTITHNTYVRLLSAPYSTWNIDVVRQLRGFMTDVTPDILAIGMEYVGNAPDADLTSIGKRLKGRAGYGPLNASGGRDEGADFNDYMGITYEYPASGGGSSDVPEAAELHCLDCSGLHRMTWGYRGGLPMTRTDTQFFDGLNLPRISRDMATDGPGIVVVEATDAVPALTDLRIGDVLFWDATEGGDEEANELDHVGTYYGVDTSGNKRFISSRKTPNGPTIGDVSGASTIDSGSNLYTTHLRLIRRY